MNEPETVSRVTVRNKGDTPLDLIFEPWAATYELAPGSALVLAASSPRPGWLHVEVGLKAVTVYTWDACVAAVYGEDGQLVDSLGVRVPDFAALVSPHMPGGGPGAR